MSLCESLRATEMYDHTEALFSGSLTMPGSTGILHVGILTLVYHVFVVRPLGHVLFFLQTCRCTSNRVPSLSHTYIEALAPVLC